MPIQLTDPWYTRFPADTELGRVEVVANPWHLHWDVHVNGEHVGVLRHLDVAMCRSETEIIGLVAKIVRTSKLSVFEQIAEIE